MRLPMRDERKRRRWRSTMSAWCSPARRPCARWMASRSTWPTASSSPSSALQDAASPPCIKLVSGLRAPTTGRLSVYGRPVTRPRGDVGIVFQNPVLLPWRDILANVMLPIEVLGQDNARGRERAMQLLSLVGLDGFEKAYPNELSGGMQQRAAIARALVYDAPLLLMDEPFGALDAMTREQMNIELQRIWSASRKTVLFITHSIPEAVFLADRIVVMSPRPGRILKIIDNKIPRMRTLDDMLRPEFGMLVREIRALIGGYAATEKTDVASANW